LFFQATKLKEELDLNEKLISRLTEIERIITKGIMKKGLPAQFLKDYADILRQHPIKESNDNFILKLIDNAVK